MGEKEKEIRDQVSSIGVEGQMSGVMSMLLSTRSDTSSCTLMHGSVSSGEKRSPAFRGDGVLQSLSRRACSVKWLNTSL